MPRRSISSIANQTPARTILPSPHTTQKRSQTRHSPDLSSPDPLAPSPEIGRKGRRRRVTIAIDEECLPDTTIKPGVEGQLGEEGEGGEVEDEAKHDAWLEFASEHYEMVEQLPLELHRNFRLLRELDDGCLDQMKQLQHQIRAYIGARMELVHRVAELAKVMDGVPETIEVEDADIPKQVGAVPVDSIRIQEEERPVPADTSMDQPNITSMEATSEEIQPVPPMPDLPPDMGDPVADGQGGLVVSSTAEVSEVIPPRNEFPHVNDSLINHADGMDEHEGADEGNADEGTKEQGQEETGVAEIDPAQVPARFLADIGKLSREVVRNCEEKVALAVGAYNSIDRHIRALDSALSAQETSLILGLRPDTLPSSGVDQSMNLAEDTLGLPEGDEEGGMVLGIGGGAGGGRKKGKRGRKRKSEEAALTAPAPVESLEMLDNEVVDPNEPRYCYCNRVSSGKMIGCDNDECPLEWFHLPCTGLQVEPQGSWWCNVCKPKVGLGKGGAGSVQPGAIEKRAGKKRKRIT